MTFDLKLADGKIVQFTGATNGPTAVARYVDLHPGVHVVAWRHPKVALLIGTDRIRG